MNQKIPLDLPTFSKEFLGIELSPKQKVWIKNSTELVNILKPGNQWGKTTVTAIKHIHHAMTKPRLAKLGLPPEGWLRTEYPTLNFGKTYEISKAVYHTILDIVNGDYLVYTPGGQATTNKSIIQKAITQVKEIPLPHIKWWNNSITLIRSYDDLGASFKMKKIAYISGDEVGDIQDLILFVNATLLPRLVFFQGNLDLVGTPQNVNDYFEIVEMARDTETSYYLLEGTMYDNPHLDPEHIKRVESVADPDLKRRMIYGEFVEAGGRFLPIADIINAFRWETKFSEDGWAEQPLRKGRYVISFDPAAANDNVAIGVLRYDCKPMKLVYLKVFKGHSVPLPMQYEMVKLLFMKYKDLKANVRFIFDGGSLGGKNVEQYLGELNGFGFPGKGRSYAEAKAQALAKMKAYFEDGREVKMVNGKEVDVATHWGLLRFPRSRKLRTELEGYKLDDKKIKNDQVMMLAMAIWYVDKLMPKMKHKVAYDFDMYETYLPQGGRKYGGRP